MRFTVSTSSALVLALGGAVIVAGCGGAAADTSASSPAASAPAAVEDVGVEGDGLVVVATTSILGDVVSNVVGDAGEVEVLMAPGVDPHSFQASAAQAASLRAADLVVANGLGLEESLDDTLAAAQEDGAVVVEVAQDMDPIPFEGADDHDHGADEQDVDADHQALDPHVWLDPQRMAVGALSHRRLDRAGRRHPVRRCLAGAGSGICR